MRLCRSRKMIYITLFQKINLLLHREQEWAIITVRFTRSSDVLLQVKSLRSLFVALMFTRPARCDLAIVFDTWGGHRVAATLRWNIITCCPCLFQRRNTKTANSRNRKRRDVLGERSLGTLWLRHCLHAIFCLGEWCLFVQLLLSVFPING